MAKIDTCADCKRPQVRIKAKGRCSVCYETYRKNMPDEERAWIKSDYPSDADMVRLMRRLGSYAKVAAEIGVARESVREYLKRRPALKSAMDAYIPALLTDEQRVENRLKSGREYQQRWRAANPELAREKRRVQMNSYGPEYRRKWNTYNRARRKNANMEMTREERQESAEYKKFISNDPCVYCGAPREHDDHIQPLARGGTDHWDNIAPACADCNLSKQGRTLLVFMLERVGSHV